MTDATPPLHPKEREQLQSQDTLLVTVKSVEEFSGDVVEAIDSLETGEAVDATPTLSFTSYEELLGTITPSVLELIEVIRREEPESINEAARAVDRDVKNVHDELTRLARIGIIYFEEEGRRKRPIVWFDEVVIDIPFGSLDDDAAVVTP